MGDSHFKSSVRAKTGDEVIRGFATVSATALSGATITGTTVTDGTFSTTSGVVTGVTSLTSAQFKMGANTYIFAGALTTEASVLALATSLTASPQGSLYLSTAGAAGACWLVTAANAATALVGAV